MQSLKFSFLGIILFTCIILLNAACVRERDTDMSAVQDQVLGEFIFNNALEIAEDASTKKTGDNLSNYKTAGYCAAITHNELSNPRTILIDFGNVNCIGNDNRSRKGKINVAYTGNLFNDVNNVITITFDNYYIDNHQVFGQSIVTRKPNNVLLQPVFDIAVTGKYLLPNTLDTLSWNANRTRTWTKGYLTPVFEDDEFELIGTGNGVSLNRDYYAMNITKSIIKTGTCRHFTSGKLDIQPQGKSLRSVDYGNGDCDKNAVAELNTKSFNIDL